MYQKESKYKYKELVYKTKEQDFHKATKNPKTRSRKI